VKLRESKFGKALVLETFARAGGYILGFRIDPVDRLAAVAQEVQTLHKLFSTNPVFGVDFTLEEVAPTVNQLLQPRAEEDTEIIEEAEDVHAIAAYYAEGTQGEDDSKHDLIRFDATVGLAVEGMQDGVTLDTLWRVI
jgi:Bardet-Biedl syndrome 5 protein